MRITDRLVFDRTSRELARARTASDEAQGLVSSGRRVTHPGDDPAVAGQIAAFQLAAARSEAMSRSANAAAQELDAADGALDQLGNVLSRARELAVRFSSDTYSATDRGAGAAELKVLFQTAVSTLNTRFGDRYLFGGDRDDAPPFDAAGNYLGDAGQRQVEVAPGVLQDAAVRADELVKGAGGGVDVLKTLSDLQAALAANDGPGIRATLDPLDQGISQVATGRAQAGVAMDALAAAAEASKLAVGDQKVQISRLADTDLAEASVRLAQAQQALQATMASAAQGFRLSLLDYLK